MILDGTDAIRAALQSRLDDIRRRLAALDGRRAALETRRDSIDEELDAVNESIDHLCGVSDALQVVILDLAPEPPPEGGYPSA